jgi:hypothetical protein
MEITRDHLVKLAQEAQHTTALFTAWSGGFDKKQKESIQTVVYYLKWIDVTTNALNNLSIDTPEATKQQMVEDLTLLVTAPLRGMLKAVQALAEKQGVKLPPQEETVTDVFAFKKWAVGYINSALETMKEKK